MTQTSTPVAPSPVATRADPDDRQTDLLPLAADVRALLDTHQPADNGTCLGCQRHWALLVPHPCWQARWALAMHDRIPDLRHDAVP